MADNTVSLNVEGMNCGHCSSMVQKTLEKIEGISNISVDLEGRKAYFDTTDENLIIKAVNKVTKAGYKASKE
jgi:copper chaperone CopZ